MVLIFCFSAQTAEQSSALSAPFSDAAGRLYSLIRTLFPALPEANAQALVFFTRKAAHAFLYFVLALWGIFALRAHTADLKRVCAITFAISVLYAISDEVHQAFLPGRAMRATDVLNDALSSLVAIGLYALIVIVKKRRRNP